MPEIWVSVPKRIDTGHVTISVVHHFIVLNLVTNMKKRSKLGLSILHRRLLRAANDLASWPSGLRVGLWSLRTRVDSPVGTYFSVYFSSFVAF